MNELLSAKPRVLVVDHEPMNRTLLDAVLRTDQRYEVLTACEGKQALATARMTRPDLIMLSPLLPGEMGRSDGLPDTERRKSNTADSDPLDYGADNQSGACPGI